MKHFGDTKWQQEVMTSIPNLLVVLLVVLVMVCKSRCDKQTNTLRHVSPWADKHWVESLGFLKSWRIRRRHLPCCRLLLILLCHNKGFHLLHHGAELTEQSHSKDWSWDEAELLPFLFFSAKTKPNDAAGRLTLMWGRMLWLWQYFSRYLWTSWWGRKLFSWGSKGKSGNIITSLGRLVLGGLGNQNLMQEKVHFKNYFKKERLI